MKVYTVAPGTRSVYDFETRKMYYEGATYQEIPERLACFFVELQFEYDFPSSRAQKQKVRLGHKPKS